MSAAKKHYEKRPLSDYYRGSPSSQHFFPVQSGIQRRVYKIEDGAVQELDEEGIRQFLEAF